MKDKWRVKPTRIGRSRKIQVRQFEPEEIWIEYELEVEDESSANEALQEATKLAMAYLNEEERKLRNKTTLLSEEVEKKPVEEYSLEITNEGRKLGNFRVKPSEDPQYANFVHLWLEKDQKEFYVGFLRKDTGDFKFKVKNKELIQEYGIKKGKHFKILKK
ncbi:MAG: hypothetical protein JSW11_19340 [Candidatus Heimdallarchaeota archaeon]|nr:MAG: hypothetical protein JSW11_19340 [Candidatus Heimdallarchaeota archaeon]